MFFKDVVYLFFCQVHLKHFLQNYQVCQKSGNDRYSWRQGGYVICVITKHCVRKPLCDPLSSTTFFPESLVKLIFFMGLTKIEDVFSRLRFQINHLLTFCGVLRSSPQVLVKPDVQFLLALISEACFERMMVRRLNESLVFRISLEILKSLNKLIL